LKHWQNAAGNTGKNEAIIEMKSCARSALEINKVIRASGLTYGAGVVLVAVSAFLFANAQAFRNSMPTTQPAWTFTLNDMTVTGGKAETVEYQGRKAIRLTTQSSEEVFAFLKGIQIQDGTIEADMALKLTTPPGVRMPGFVGIAFRARTDASHYEMFYLRPGNSLSEDQAMRNHSVQYVASPGFDWYKLRREWPWVYESYADLRLQAWTKVKIEVHGRIAKLYVNGSEKPGLIVNGLKGEVLLGNVALWGYSGEEAYFSNVKVIPAKAEAVTNDGEVSGTWNVEFASDYGKYVGSMNLHRNGNTVSGIWSGAFGKDLPISGTWRNGYVELTFTGTWPEKQLSAKATLAGWIDGDSATGRMKVESRADGQWTALKKK
jgi:hypothetical protein